MKLRQTPTTHGFDFAAIPVKFLCVCLIIMFSLGSPAANGDDTGDTEEYVTIPNGFENYNDRPDILTVTPRAHNIDQNWQNIKNAHFTTVALLLALYPDHELYFMARDAELLHDTARLLYRNQPEILARIHLLSVSSWSMTHIHVKDYLHEEGISETDLVNGKKVVFVDTGFKGTVPVQIKSMFSEHAQQNMTTQLLLSENTLFPSTRTFVSYLDGKINSVEPSLIHSAIADFEDITKYTDRSSNYIHYQGRWISITLTDRIRGGFINRAEAIQHMEDFANEASKPETLATYAKNQQLIAKIMMLLKQNDASALKVLLAQERLLTESVIRDIIDAQKNIGMITNLKAVDLGLATETYLESTQKPRLSQTSAKTCIDLFILP